MDVQEGLAGTSTVTTRLLLRAAAERGGPTAVERALGEAGLAGEGAMLRSLRGRVSYETKLRLFDGPYQRWHRHCSTPPDRMPTVSIP